MWVFRVKKVKKVYRYTVDGFKVQSKLKTGKKQFCKTNTFIIASYYKQTNKHFCSKKKKKSRKKLKKKGKNEMLKHNQVKLVGFGVNTFTFNKELFLLLLFTLEFLFFANVLFYSNFFYI